MATHLTACTAEETRPEDRPENLTVAVFLTAEATEPQTRAVEDRLRSVSDVTDFRFVDHAAAYEKMKTMFKDKPELVESVKPDQLPESFEFKLPNRTAFERTYRGPLRADLRQLPGVDSVIFRGKPSQKSMSECVSEELRIAPVPPVKLEIDVFLTDGTTDAEKQAIEARLLAIPGAGEVTFRSRQEGYERTKELLKDVHPQVMASAKPEDLPEALVLTITDRELAYQATDQKVDEQLCRMPGVDQVLVPPKPLSLD
ncbi:MAG: permease-like cell division protein FtsX [Micromonospora sp.]